MVDEKAIEPHVALWEKYVRDTGAYPRSDFIYDKASDSYSCPGGKELSTPVRKMTRSALNMLVMSSGA